MFTRIAHQTIMSGTVVRYRWAGERDRFEISASRDGVIVSGHSPHLKGIEVSDVVVVLERAGEWHKALIPNRINSRDVDAVPLSKEPECVVATYRAVFAGDDVLIESRSVAPTTTE